MTTVEEIAEMERKLAEMKRSVAIVPAVQQPLKLDLGCGSPKLREHNQTSKAEGWTGIDAVALPGVDVVCDLTETWPWPDSSVDEVNCAHMLEHVPANKRIQFCNELWRALKPGAKARIVTPHWCSPRAYGDMTHEWPPVAEMFWTYLDKKWREDNSVVSPAYRCDFTGGTQGYSPTAWLNGRTLEFQLDAFQSKKAAADDMISVITARK